MLCHAVVGLGRHPNSSSQCCHSPSARRHLHTPSFRTAMLTVALPACTLVCRPRCSTPASLVAATWRAHWCPSCWPTCPDAAACCCRAVCRWVPGLAAADEGLLSSTVACLRICSALGHNCALPGQEPTAKAAPCCHVSPARPSCPPLLPRLLSSLCIGRWWLRWWRWPPCWAPRLAAPQLPCCPLARCGPPWHLSASSCWVRLTCATHGLLWWRHVHAERGPACIASASCCGRPTQPTLLPARHYTRTTAYSWSWGPLSWLIPTEIQVSTGHLYRALQGSHAA